MTKQGITSKIKCILIVHKGIRRYQMRRQKSYNTTAKKKTETKDRHKTPH